MILRKYEEETAKQGIEDPNLEAQRIILDTIDERQQAIDDQEKLGAKEFDPLYQRIDMNLDRLLKMMTGHS